MNMFSVGKGVPALEIVVDKGEVVAQTLFYLPAERQWFDEDLIWDDIREHNNPGQAPKWAVQPGKMVFQTSGGYVTQTEGLFIVVDRRYVRVD